MDYDRSRIAAFLAKIYLFYGLTSNEVIEAEKLFQIRRCEQGEVIYSQGDAGDFFYIVYQGKLTVSSTMHGRVSQATMTPGDYFGQESLIFERPRTSSVKASEACVLLSLGLDTFHQLLALSPKIHQNLAATAESRRLARRLEFPWLGSNEIIYYIGRKHWMVAVRSFIIPLILLISAGIFSWFGYKQGISFSNAWFILAVLFILLAIATVAWFIVDYRNDYYVVTNRRLVKQEKIVLLWDSRNEAPLETILAVDSRSSVLGRAMDFGFVSARTYTGAINMEYVNQPNLMAEFIEGFKQRAQIMAEEEEEEVMARAIREALDRQHNPLTAKDIKVVPAPRSAPEKKVEKTSFREKYLRNLLKVRYEEHGVITYRKSWPILVREIFWPLVFIAFFGTGLFFFFRMGLLADLRCLTGPMFLLIGLGLFGWLLYNYVNWRNDIYQITNEQILDIEKKPLGEERKKTARLENVLSVEHIRPNIFAVIFNYGTVIVNVGETRFTFYGVFNPDQAHRDVTDRQEALKRRKEQVAKARDRERMVKWFIAYHSQNDTIPHEEL